MRKTDDAEIQRMYSEEGKSKREIARHCGVSEQYIGKRLKQLEAFKLPDSFQRLTTKQKRYALARIEGKSKTESAMEAYDTKDRASAKALGHTLSREPDVNVAILDLMAQLGISRRQRIERLKDMIHCSDMSVVGKGLDISFKLGGEYSPEKIEAYTSADIRALIASLPLHQKEDEQVTEIKEDTH